ncbi:hypothetical protein QVD17_03896 [Tagetes erecta]|uniref:FHA domain-containing protein n=1 Tax=Tagetes erecta TaxID=13708 RepID=A0AAD8P930_TARER|nr:hypothetical protein QVD17_03896 [Tagetes erecta]
MEEAPSLKLIMEKGPREGETLTYTSSSLVKIGRLVRGNTIGIKDAGISTKHICIQFDNELRKWTLCDLDSSNGTFLNEQILKPYAPSVLADGDCIKIGELTSIIVKYEVASVVRPRRNLRRQGKSVAGEGDGSGAGVENGKVELGLGLGFDGELGENEVKEPVRKRNLRSGVRRDVDVMNQVETVGSRRVLRNSKKENVSESVDLSVPVEPKKRRGRKKKIPQEIPVDPALDQTKAANVVVLVEPLENAQSSGLEENLNNAGEGNEAAFDKLSVELLEKLKDSGLGDNLDNNNESAQEHLVEKLVSGQGKEVMVDKSSLKGKEVAEEPECFKELKMKRLNQLQTSYLLKYQKALENPNDEHDKAENETVEGEDESSPEKEVVADDE